MNTTTEPTLKQQLNRAVWLAFQASSAMGMGFIHADSARKQTEESLAQEVGDGDDVYLDYCHGRMMKTRFFIKDDALRVTPEEPRHDYQSWAGTYKTATALLDAVKASFA